MLKRLSGLSRSAIKKTREILGVDESARPDQASPDRAAPAETECERGSGDARNRTREATRGETQGTSQGTSQGAITGASTGESNAGSRKPDRERPKNPRSERSRGGRGGRGDPDKRGDPRERSKGSASEKPEPAVRGSGKSVLTGSPRIVPRADHPVSRKMISRSALKVLDRLNEAGFGAFLVGGGVRDALVGMLPKDFDIATDASPEDVRALFRNSRIIGRRFRLVHVVFGREIIEVATFRAAHDKGEGGEIGASGRIVRDNVFGSIEEDALRRDFSVNALYYNVADRSVIDYAGGLDDVEKKVFRLIGDPLTRCEEDPVRVLRAVRLSAKLGFSIDPTTEAAMKTVAPELAKTPPARLFEEVLKLFQGGYAERSFAAVDEHDLLRYLFPLLQKRLASDGADVDNESGVGIALRRMLDAALSNTDRRVDQGKPITPSYLLAFMLWPDIEERAREACAEGLPVHQALRDAADQVLARQLRVISIPRRFSGPMKEIWQMQPRLERLRGARALRLMEDRRFRAAYDFLCLRASIDERLSDAADWWTAVQELPAEDRAKSAADRPLALGLWGDGSSDADDVPVGGDAEDDGGRSPSASRRRRGGRRRNAGDAGKVDEGKDDKAGGHQTTATGERDATVVDETGAVVVHDTVAAVADGSVDDKPAAPKKKRRRRRRRPGGDASRTPGGGTGGGTGGEPG